MKVLKRLNLLLLFISLLISVFIVNVSVIAADKIAENVGATYRVEKVVEKCDLGYGLTYSRNIAFSSAKSGHYIGKDGGTVGSVIVPDKEYQQQVNLLEMEKNSEVQLIPYAYLTYGLWNKLTIKKAAMQFELDNPGKKVIAGVNGDWFQIDCPQPASSGVTISNGEYYKNHTIHGAVNTLVFDNELESGKRVYQIADIAVKPMLAIYDENGNIIKEVQINKVNSEPSNGEIALYYARKTSEFYHTTIEQKVTNAYIIDRAQKAVTTIDPNYTIDSFYGLGKITSFESSFDLGSTNFAIKSNNSSVDEYLEQGVTVRCQFEYQNEALSGVKNAIGFPYGVMKNGEPIYPVGDGYTSGYIEDAKVRKPRTFLGIREDGSVVFATVDGRQSSANMHGMTSMEMAATMKYYGCVDSWKFDGGGSATMIIRKQSGFEVSASFNEKTADDWVVVNSPSDGNERSDGNCLLMVVDAPQIELEVEDITNNYVVFNVVLLSELEKYSEIYIFMDGKGYLVEDSKVKIEGLKTETQYEFFVYGKKNNKYYDLGVRKLVKAALKKPTEIEMKFTIIEKNKEKFIQIYYKVDNKQAIRSIDIEIDGKKYGTVSTTVLLPYSSKSFEAINNLEIKVIVVTSEYIGRETIVFTDCQKEYSLSFLMDEMNFTIQDFINGIFTVE